MYIGLKYQDKTPFNYQYTLFDKMREKWGFFWEWVGTRKEGMRVNMVDVF
jgi:hypothetical protein